MPSHINLCGGFVFCNIANYNNVSSYTPNKNAVIIKNTIYICNKGAIDDKEAISTRKKRGINVGVCVCLTSQVLYVSHNSKEYY